MRDIKKQLNQKCKQKAEFKMKNVNKQLNLLLKSKQTAENHAKCN